MDLCKRLTPLWGRRGMSSRNCKRDANLMNNP
jgi:hypothetical protein